MIYYETPRMRMSWDESLKAVFGDGGGFVDGAEFRKGMDIGVDVLKKHRATKWLADMRDRRVMTEGDQTWVAEDWFPRAAAGGLRFTAFVVPSSVLAQMSLKRLVQTIGAHRLETAYFDTLEAARAWLRSKR